MSGTESFGVAEGSVVCPALGVVRCVLADGEGDDEPGADGPVEWWALSPPAVTAGGADLNQSHVPPLAAPTSRTAAKEVNQNRAGPPLVGRDAAAGAGWVTGPW
ncbi:hypothetical protein ACIA74_09060 [Streptomyces sp. NPDC051658]|uniref:hypothetical protein n=1 Tax=Streptomyces sp. NPDC051658 TaxID=3365667 RepID=UPI0037A93041